MSGYKLPCAVVVKGRTMGSADCAACGGTGLGEAWKDEHTLADCEPCGGIGMVAYDILPAMWQGKSRLRNVFNMTAFCPEFVVRFGRGTP